MNELIRTIMFVLGAYILLDTLYIASRADSDKRWCMTMKYLLAFISGTFLTIASIKAETVHWSYGVLSATIAMFLWPDTLYRIRDYIELHSPKLHLLLLKYIPAKSRRRTE